VLSIRLREKIGKGFATESAEFLILFSLYYLICVYSCSFAVKSLIVSSQFTQKRSITFLKPAMQKFQINSIIAIMNKEFKFNITAKDAGTRLDVFASNQVVDLTRSQAKKLIEEGHITVNGITVKAHHILHENDIVKVIVPPPEEPTISPEEIPLEILFQDDSIIIVNKPPGMVVHPGAGNFSHTLVNALIGMTSVLSDGTHPLRPGIVHRLDKGTSGCLIVAKNNVIHHKLTALFTSRNVEKEYRAIVANNVKSDSGEVKTLIDRCRRDRKRMVVAADKGREAVTHYEVIERFGFATYIKAFPKTGRTHQIRVHMAHLGNPLFGDLQYSRGKVEKSLGIEVPRLMLHAYHLNFMHPLTGQEMQFEAPIPQDFLSMLNTLRNLEDNRKTKRR
jgi:23S rRNA pseudouridine1911/1915/1917 synthase